MIAALKRAWRSLLWFLMRTTWPEAFAAMVAGVAAETVARNAGARVVVIRTDDDADRWTDAN